MGSDRRRVPRAAVAAAALGVCAVLLTNLAPAPATGAMAAGPSYRLDYVSTPGPDPRVRWNPCQQAITYKVNLRYAGGNTAAKLAQVKEAVRRLSAATRMRFVYEGRTTQLPRTTRTAWWRRQTTTEIVVAWVNQSRASSRSNLLGRHGNGGSVAGSGGYVYKYYKSGARYVAPIGRGYVVLNAARDAGLRGGFGSGLTRGSLLLHELGHAVGLQHVSDRRQLMYPVLLRRSAASYRAGDRAGLARLGRPAGCLHVPSWVWRQV